MVSIWQVPCQKLLERRSCEAQVACIWQSLEPIGCGCDSPEKRRVTYQLDSVQLLIPMEDGVGHV